MNIDRRRAVTSRAVPCEKLEPRMLLSLAPAGAEFRVNTFTTNSQSNAAIAVDGDGDFVVTWDSYQEGVGGGVGIYAQRYSASGAAQGAEFHVNSTTTGGQQKPAVAMDADGDFVIVWSGYGPGDSDGGIFGRRYNAAGVPQGGEFRANTFIPTFQADPAVASDAAGNFVVSWTSSQDGSGQGVYAQRYNAAGAPQGSEFRANTFTAGNQSLSSVAMDASGNLVIAWSSANQDGSNNGIYAQRYDAAGVPQGGEFRVNTFTTGDQAGAAVAMDASGDFVIAWFSPQDAPGNFGIYAQRYNAAGVAQGSEFRVNTTTASTQFLPSVAMDADGEFLVAWASYGQDGSDAGVYAQSFNASGAPQGVEFRVNTFTAGNQNNAAVAMDADGNAVVVWRSFGQDGSSYGIYAQRYSESNPDTAAPMVGGLFVNGQKVMPGQVLGDVVSSFVLSFSEDMSVAGGASGANSATNPANYVLLRNGIDVSSQIESATFGFNPTTRKFEVTLGLTTGLSTASYVLKARDTLRDLAGNALDGDFDGAAGGDFALAFSGSFHFPFGDELRVNTFTTGGQGGPSAAMDADGEFVIAWSGSGAGDIDGIFAQRFDAAGGRQGPELRVNTFTTGSQHVPSVAMDALGNFVVVWAGAGDGDPSGVFAQRYNAQGVAQGGEFRINALTTGEERSPNVAMDADGDFVVTWQIGIDPNSASLRAGRFNALGQSQGELAVPGVSAAGNHSPSIAIDASGNFIIVWIAETQIQPPFPIFESTLAARRFSASGVGGSQFNPTGATAGVTATGSSPVVAMDSDGDFVVAWSNSLSIGSPSSIFARRFGSGGVGGEVFTVHTSTASALNPEVATDADGDFVVSWEINYTEGSGYGVYARRYSSAGTPLGLEFLVNTFTTGNQNRPAVAMSQDGNFVATWNSAVQDPDGSAGVYAQLFVSLIPEPTVSGSSFNFITLPHRLEFRFSQNVSASLGTNDIVLENLTTQQTIPSSDLALSYDTSTNTATFSYTGNASGIAGVLPDGQYRATLLASGIFNTGGVPLQANHIFNFFFLNGDANRDGRVNLADFNILAANFGLVNRTFEQGDFDYDTAVFLSDFNILASRFGQVLAAATFADGSIRGTRSGRDPSGGTNARDDLRELLEELS